MFVAGAALSLVLLGGTSAALASQSLLDWLGFTPDQTIQHVNADGDVCAAGMVVRPEGVPDDDASFLAAKRAFLAIDFDTLRIPDHIRNDERYSAKAQAARSKAIDEYNAAHPKATMRPSRPDPESQMLVSTAYELISGKVKAKGLDSTHFALEAGGQCNEVTR